MSAGKKKAKAKLAVKVVTPKKAMTDDQIIEACQRKFGIEKDELTTLYPSEEARRKFYEESALKMGELDNEAETGEDEEAEVDDYELTAAQQIELRQRRDYKKEVEDEHKERAVEAGMANQDHLPESERVTPKEARLTYEELMRQMDEESEKE